MVELREMHENRHKAVVEARKILDKVAEEKREMTTEENQQWKSYITEADGLFTRIKIETEQREQERKLAEIAINNVGGDKRKEITDDVEIAFRKLILEGERSLSNDEIRSLKAGLIEARGLTAGTDIKGGFTLTPQKFIDQLLANVKDKVFMRQLGTVIPLNGASSCGIPSLDTDVGDADWTPEIKPVVEDDSLAFGTRELKPHGLSKLVKVSEPLLRNSALPIDAIVSDRMAYKFGVAMEKGYLLGNGASKALGVFVPSKDGIPTTRDFSTGNTATEVTADGLINVKYSLKAQYMTKAQWLFHRDGISQLAKLKDGDGGYIFDLSDKPGVPDMLLGRPLMMSEFAPNTFTASQYVGMFGDFSFYWIADSLALQVRRLNELFALTNQIGIIGRMETDGMPVLAEAFSRIKLAAS